MNNRPLNRAKSLKNDEFYTRIEDIEREVNHYTKQFENKVVYCNCDNPVYSNFWRYFHRNFEKLHLKELISTHYRPNGGVYKLSYNGGGTDNDISIADRQLLTSNGDFRCAECMDFMKNADIICTNPPFSLLNEFVLQLVTNHKKFLIVANLNAVKYSDIFPLFINRKIWIGNTTITKFTMKDGSLKTFGNTCWFTNLKINRENSPLPLTKTYKFSDYPIYDTYPAIEVNRVENIPRNFYGLLGVPISFIYKHCPNQFELIGEFNHGGDNEWDLAKPVVKGTELYPRLAIRLLKN